MTEPTPRRRLSLGKKLAFAVITSVMVLGGIEGVLRALGYPKGLVRSFSKLWNPDTTSRDELAGLFRPDYDATVAYPPELAYQVHFNEQGLRGPSLSDAPRLLLLGDSVTFGYHVEDDETYPAQLQLLLAAEGSPYQVVNAGCGHFTVSDERRYLNERLLKLAPRAVLLQFCSNDVTDGELRREPTLYEEILSDDESASNALGQLAIGEVILRLQIALKRWRKGAPESLGVEPQANVPAEAWATYEAELALLYDSLAQQGIPLAIVAFPDLVAARTQQPSKLDAKLEEITTRLGIPFRSALEAYRQVSDPESLFLYPLDPHPSPAGNELLARVASDLLRDAKILSAQPPSSSE